MKRNFIAILAAILLPCLASGADKEIEWQYSSLEDLNLFNKLVPTESPFARLDPDKVGISNKSERRQSQESAGFTVAFNTNSTAIAVKAAFSYQYQTPHTPNNAKQGFDLYVKVDGQWIWAGSAGAKDILGEEQFLKLAENLKDEMKECLVYFPLGSIITSFSLATEKGSTIEKGQTPFKGRIAVFGSSFTHGAGCSRSGMTYAAQLSRMTGYNFINMGFSGRSHLQPYFAHALCEAPDVDAYVIDGFSNPSADRIRERLFPFIEVFQKEKPGVPLIFIKTIYREYRATRPKAEEKEALKMHVADSLMKIACKQYKDVYYITTTSAHGKYSECTTDGIHPDSHGYTLWAESIKKPITKIIKRYSK